jgi:small-conductance mechanosensitive channel
VLLGLAKAHPLAQQVLGCPVNQVGPAGLGLNLNVWVADPKSAGTLKADLLESGFKEFARRGIRLPSNGTAVTVQWPTASPPREAAAPGVPSAPS